MGGLECRNSLPEILPPRLYLQVAGYYLVEQKTGKTSHNFQIFKTKCLMKKVENLQDFVEVQLHANFFAWATETVIYILVLF